MNTYTSSSIIAIHDNFDKVTFHNNTPAITDSLSSRIIANHFYNTSLWDEEDLARRKNVSDSLIAENKRNIDEFNQKRNDAIERIDEFIIADLNIAPSDSAQQHTETVGAIIDRLSILSLKIRAMRIESARFDAGSEHIQKCTQKLSILEEQRHDLAIALDKLFEDIINRKRYYKIYRQFKMYNDPTLNPALYSSSTQSE